MVVIVGSKMLLNGELSVLNDERTNLNNSNRPVGVIVMNTLNKSNSVLTTEQQKSEFQLAFELRTPTART